MFTNSPPTTTTSLRIDHLDEQSETSSSFISRSNNSPQQGQLQHGNELQNHQGDHQLFVIDPDTNSWRFGNRGRSGGSGVVQSVEEQELLSSIQDLQRQLMEVRDEKEEWIEADKIDSERNEEDGNKEDNKTLNETETKRVVVVSNRLPVSVQKTTKGGRDVWTFEKTSGGLVSALRAAKEELDFLWVGWVGHYIPEEDRATVRQKLIAEHGCVPIFLDKSIVNGYYHGFSNDILWPLFHYEPLPCFRPGQEKKFDVKQWDAYRRANDIFANAVNDILEDTDVCWIHDYHLMLVPRILRRLNPKVPIGFFLHVPFPSSDIYRMLPVRRKILEGVLAADLVGFHTYDYMRHFLSSASRILGVESSPKGIATKSGHFCSLGVFPIGIEPLFFQNVLERPSCQRRVAELCKRLGKVHILIGVDRLDYIKGMPHKLLAYEHLLKTRPEYRGNIVLIQVGVPSRVQVKEYQKLASQVNELVGRINGSFGTLDYTPIHYIQRPVSTEELCALYNVADACVITSIRDGMNLVSHEYVALQEFPCPGSRDGPGMLVLSEFAGAAQSLSGAIRINPWNIDELSDAMHQALSTEKAVRELQQKKLYRYVSTHTSSVWARSFIEEISSSSVKRIDQVTLRLERQQREKETKDVTSEIELTGGKDKQQDGNINVINSLGGNGNGIGTSIETEKGELKSSLGRRSSIHSSTDINTGSEGGQISTSVSGVAVEKYRGQKKEKGISGAVGSGKERSGGTTQSGRRSGRKWRTRRLPIVRMLQAYKQADSAVQHNRVLVLDYDGLLATRDVVPELSRPSPFVTSYLVQLASNPSNLLVVLSGRSRTVLETWLTAPDGSPIDCAIGAENGVFFRENPNSKWENMGLVQDAETWKSQVLPIMQFFSERTPGSHVEIKDGSLTWFYGDSDPTFASWQGKELRVHIDEVMTNFAISVLQTSYFFEVRSQGCTKSRILDILLHRLSQTQRYPDHALPSFVLSMSSDLGRPTIFEATSKAFQEKLDSYKKSSTNTNTTNTSTASISNTNISNTTEDASSLSMSTNKKLVAENGQEQLKKTKNVESIISTSPDYSKHMALSHVVNSNEKIGSSGSGSGGLASVGVFNCFYGPQKDRDATDADFYVEAESDLRTLLRGIAKLSDSETN